MRNFLVFFILISILSSVSALASSSKAGFYTIRGNSLEPADYTFEQFANHFEDQFFICIDAANRWNEQFEAVYMITNTSLNQVVLTEVTDEHRTLDRSSTIIVRNDNFKEFRKAFSYSNSLQFENHLPVKFYKVKTVTRTQDIIFLNSPDSNRQPVKTVTPFEKGQLFYYAYKSRFIEKRKYVLLGTAPYAIQNFKGMKDTIIGWVCYENNENKENAVLWNTNIGLRPIDSNKSNTTRKPIVFRSDYDGYKAALKYYKSGNKGDRDLIIVDEDSLLNFHKRYKQKNGKINRWLPMYIVPYVPPHSLMVGVIEDIGEVRRDIENLLTTKYLRLVLLVDATASMRQIWENLGDVLINVLQQMTSKTLLNIENESIKLKIKLFSYHEKPNVINDEHWIVSKYDVEEYKGSIKHLTLKSTTLRPNIYQALTYINHKIGGDPYFIVVMGDAGDLNYAESFSEIGELKEKTKHSLIVPYGIRFDSKYWSDSDYIKDNQMRKNINKDISKSGYYTAHKRFSDNFQIIMDINDSNISKNNVVLISRKITDSITKEMTRIIYDAKNIMISDIESKIELTAESIFSIRYLTSISDTLTRSEGKGSFFEEGYVHIKDPHNNNIYEKDLLIKEIKIRDLINALSEFRDEQNKPGFRRLLMKIICIFFEINLHDVDNDFLRKTTLQSFWIRVVGDKQVATRLIPELFNTNLNFSQIVNEWSNNRKLFIRNAGQIRKQLKSHIEKNIGFFPVIIVPGIAQNNYYWVDVENIKFFRGIY